MLVCNTLATRLNPSGCSTINHGEDLWVAEQNAMLDHLYNAYKRTIRIV